MQRSTFLIFIALIGSAALIQAQEDAQKASAPVNRTEAARRLQANGHHSEAREEFIAALREAEKRGTENLDVAMTLDGLGSVSEDLELFADAERAFKRSIAVLDRTVGPVHPNIVTVLTHLAALYVQTGRPERAEPLLRRALEIRVKSSGPDELARAELLHETAILNVIRRKRTEAESLFHAALAIFEKHLGAESVTVASVLSSLACFKSDSYRDGEASSYAERSWSILGKLPNPPAAPSVKALWILGVVYARSHREAEADSYFEKALAISEKSFGRGSLVTACVLRDYASLLRRLKRKSEASQMDKRTAQILTNNARDYGWGRTVSVKAFSR